MNRVIYFVVGDRGLNAGNGIYVSDMEAMKRKLLRKKVKGEWQLVISIHGAEDAIATRGGNLKNRSANGVYEASELKKLFTDNANFSQWRKKYGPTWTTLNACQVHRQFEAVILSAFNKPTAKQKPQGLGQGCRPLTHVEQYYPKNSGKPVKTRSQWGKLSKSDKAGLNEALVELNKKVGYFGGPAVAEALLLAYFFDEEPKGGWPSVTVSFNKQDTGISFNNRINNTRFMKSQCKDHLGPIKGRTATTPPVP